MAHGNRVAMLDLNEARLRAARSGIPEGMAALSVFRIALHQPGVAAALYGMLEALLWKGLLDARLRELIIMRIGWATGSVYEWTQHWQIARLLDVPERDLLGVRDWRGAGHFGTAERAVLAATDETLRAGTISEETWISCHAALGGQPALLVELVTAIGNWQMFSALLRSLDVPLEKDVKSWPPDGQAPP